MSLTENTSSLQSILDGVNALPSGKEVRSRSGTLTFRNGSATVSDIGFQPDIFAITTGATSGGVHAHAAADFSYGNEIFLTFGRKAGTSLLPNNVLVSRNGSTVYLSDGAAVDLNWGMTPLNGSCGYKAYKFT